MSIISKVFIALGVLLLVFAGLLTYQRYNPKRLEFKNVKISHIKPSEIAPIAISIPSQNIKNSIYPAKIENNNWETTDKGVSYLASTPIPGEKGNSIFYGHNWQSVLGNLTKVKPGQEIIITLNNGELKKFTINYTSIVSPDDSHILDQSQDNRITIYTCTGFLDSKRFVAVATLK